ncbi:TOPRIM nucleotidyl transferase/hydrolase domain-containing protein [Pseudomonas orientalis]|uniref:TOPRIM nucleotidyl transferase/hydrolase domain-containing protein n=1 Tax=Pseudomonas orientalis TaxID=76758 RepID=UPI000F5753D7|nr:TOPRIM nucleotidyl transferase/hydrolase domain-containing protein [Pseudomonas orientalis]AZE90150.1 hypothetical protein C4J97_3456 [Pseudomonas orientalis]
MEKYSSFRTEINFDDLLIGNDYLLLIKHSLEASHSFLFDNLLNNTIRLYIENADEINKHILVTDKFHIYRMLWKAILERLYTNYLPSQKYIFKWSIEATPYTLLQCRMSNTTACHPEFEITKNILGISLENIDHEYDYLLEAMDLKSLGLPNGLCDILPDNLIPESKSAQLNLLFRLMSFPPLEELAVFFMTYGAYTSKQVDEIASAFPGVTPPKNLGFDLKGVIGGAYYNLDHSTFQREKLEGLEARVYGEGFENNFLEIRNYAAAAKKKKSDLVICPCCGESEKIEMPEEASQFALLIQDRVLSKRIGLLYFEDYYSGYITRLRHAFSEFKNDLNKTDHPKCMILVEGESEETALPLLAAKSGLLLDERRIKVFNCKSKQKLWAHFYQYPSAFPKMKMICLLDSDAEKERDEIVRLIKNKRDRYHLTFINKGCFEDLFDISNSIKILNEIYPGEPSIELSDFEEKKDFGDNIKRILHEKRKTRFDKVLFAETIALKIPANEIPKQICEIFEIALKFTEPKSFIAE